MNKDSQAIIILAAGKGTRMKSAKPKVMHELAGRPMLSHLLATIKDTAPAHTVIVTSPENDSIISAAVAPIKTVVQPQQKGTGDAVKCAMKVLQGFTGDVLILFGDVPLITPATIKAIFAEKAKGKGSAIVLLGFTPDDASGYGRIVQSESGNVESIVEHKDATASQKQITLCNSGIMCVSGGKLTHWLAELQNHNAAGEYYLTDIIATAKKEGEHIVLVQGSEDELMGINTLEQLSIAEAMVQDALRSKFMAAGVTLKDPLTTYFSYDTQMGADVVIEPCVFIGQGVKIASGTTVKAFSHFEGATIGKSATVGPFSRLRPQAEIADEAHIGNFVEVKKSTIAKGAKVNHLTYIGDAKVGAKANIGAGTITCNYDGFDKHLTEIGEGAFIGSNSALVAPVKIGAGAIVGAGSAIGKDVPADALALTRAPQVNKEGWAKKFRDLKTQKKQHNKGK